MNAETIAGLVEKSHIPQNPSAPAALAAVLSLVVPGLGQAWLGQWSRGFRVFAASATLCFGLGLANLLAAYDAWSVGKRNQREDITAATSSKSLMVFTTLWSGFCIVLDSFIDAMNTGPGLLLSLPLMLVSWLAGGKGFSR